MNESHDPKSLEFEVQSLHQATTGILEKVASILAMCKISNEDYCRQAVRASRSYPDRAEYYLDEQFPTVVADPFRRINLARACIYAMRSHIASQRCEQDAAWYCISVSYYEIGLFEGSSSGPVSSNERIEFAQKGGYARSDKYAPVRAEFARLLKCMRPKGGWVDEKQVIKIVKDTLFQFSQIHGGHLKENSFDQNIRRWLRGSQYPHVQAAWTSSKR